jgi:hypothetical protein
MTDPPPLRHRVDDILARRPAADTQSRRRIQPDYGNHTAPGDRQRGPAVATATSDWLYSCPENLGPIIQVGCVTRSRDLTGAVVDDDIAGVPTTPPGEDEDFDDAELDEPQPASATAMLTATTTTGPFTVRPLRSVALGVLLPPLVAPDCRVYSRKPSC